MKRLLLLIICFPLFSDLAVAQTGYSKVFPQFANGRLSDGSFYRSTLVVQNIDPISPGLPCAFWTYGVASQIFTDSSERTLVTDSSNRVSFTLGSLRSQVFQSSGTGSLGVGFVGVGCSTPWSDDWGAFLLFTFYNPAGVKLSEATVFPAQIASNAPAAQLVVDHREGARLGIALANADNRVGEFDLTIRDVLGNFVERAFISLGPSGQTAKFLDELVPLPPNFVGTVAILPRRQYASPGVYAIGLRFTGTIFTTVPVLTCVIGDSCSR